MAIAGLKSKAKYVRSELGKRMKLRLTPEIRFIEDLSIERGSRVSSSNTLSCWNMQIKFLVDFICILYCCSLCYQHQHIFSRLGV